MNDFLVVQEAAKYCSLSREYLDYLRTVDASVRGLSGPPHTRKFGRIVYPVGELSIWNADRLEKKVRKQ